MPRSEPDTPHPRVDDWLDEENVEYDVEPPDEEVGRVRKRLQDQKAEDVLARAEIDEGWYHAQMWEADLKWRFSLRDLFAVTAIVAISLTALQYGGICGAAAVAGIGTFFWLLTYMERLDPTIRPGPRVPGDNDGCTQRRRLLPPFSVSYSTADLLIAMTIAAVCFSLLRIFPPPLAAASLGFLVLAGIVMYWLGASPPRRAVLVWFILTAMYLVVSAIAIVQEG
jgi:hypothetical protein